MRILKLVYLNDEISFRIETRRLCFNKGSEMESGLKEMQDVSFNSRFCVFAKGLLRCAKVQKGMVIKWQEPRI